MVGGDEYASSECSLESSSCLYFRNGCLIDYLSGMKE